jgi:hypothetical protein
MVASSNTPFTRASLPRCPLISDELAKKHNVHFEIDTRFRKAARLLQALWLQDHNIETGIHIRGEGDTAVVMPLHSNLSRNAARAGKNFLSPDIHAFVRHELLMREEGAAIDEERLFGNALSSMPLCFNLFGPMALDLKLASDVFRGLLPDFVEQIEGFIFEHSPGRREERFLHDGTAFDLAMRVVTPDGEPGTVFIEVKYSEDMTGPAARLRDRYYEVSRKSGLFVDPDSPVLRSLGLEQLWREHMLAQLTVEQEIVQRAMFIAVGSRLNRRVMAAFKVYENQLIDGDDRDANRVAFQALTLESIIEAMQAAGANDLARDLWRRYADFERIYHLSLHEFVDCSSDNAVASTLAPLARPPAVTRSAGRSRQAGPPQKAAARSQMNPKVVK